MWVRRQSTDPVAGAAALLVIAALAAGGWLLPRTAHGQAEIGEIVVTVRKVEENVMEIPVAVTAFTEQQIESAAIANLQDVANLTPGLQFLNPIGEALPVPIIRGVAPTEIRGENNTAIFVDGVYVSGREGLNFSQLDVARIEVVKGPQSAQYGRNAFSGAINYITKRPSDVFEAKSELTGGNDGKALASGTVSGPLIDDVLSGRAGVMYNNFDGTYDNPVPGGQDIGGYRYRTYQGSLYYTPVDGLDALLNVYYSNDNIDDGPLVAYQANCEDDALYDPTYQDSAGVPAGVHLAAFCGTVPTLSGNDIAKVAESDGEDRTVTRLSLNVDWEIGVGTVSLLTGYTDTSQDSRTDFNRNLGYDTPFVYCNDGGVLGASGGVILCQDPTLQRFFAGALDIENGSKTEEISQEIRFTSPRDESLRYSFGGYYYKSRLKVRNGDILIVGDIPDTLTRYASSDPRTLPGDSLWCPCQDIANTDPTLPPRPSRWLTPFGSAIFGPSTEVPPNVMERQDDTWSGAGFAGAEWDFAEDLTVSAEARFTHDKKDSTFSVTPVTRAEDSWNLWTGRLALKYQVNERWMAYTSVANGTKSGGFDGEPARLGPRIHPGDPLPSLPAGIDSACDQDIGDEVATTCNVYSTVDPEKNVTYEVGAKGTTRDGRVALELAMFRIDWTDIVLPQVYTTFHDRAVSGGAVSLNQNAGDATVQGWEAAMSILFTDNLSGNFGLSYQNAVWNDAFIDTSKYWPTFYPDGNVTGNEVLRQAPWTANGSLNYRRQLDGEWDWYGRTDVSWKDSWYVGNDNLSKIPAHTNVNLRFGVESSRYTIEVWSQNLFDDGSPSSAYRDIYWTDTPDLAAAVNPPTSTLADFPVLRLTVNEPSLRTYGLTARVRFGGAER